MLGCATDEQLATGFLGGSGAGAALDISAVNIRALAAIQRSTQLDHDPPFRRRRPRTPTRVLPLFLDGMTWVDLGAADRSPA